MEEKENRIWSMCRNKRGYDTRSQAKSIANKMKRCGSKNLTIYKCPYCSLYHVGHRKNPGKIKIW